MHARLQGRRCLWRPGKGRKEFVLQQGSGSLGGFPNGSKLRFTGAGACSFLISVTQCNYSLGLKNQGSRATLVLWTKEAQSLREVRTLDSSPCSLSQKAIPSSLACPSILDLGKYENASRGGYNLNLCTQSKISTPRRGWPGSP